MTRDDENELQLERVLEGFRVRLRYGKGLRGRFLIRIHDEIAAKKRALRMRELANDLARNEYSEEASVLLKKAGAVTNERDLAEILKFASELCSKRGKQPARASGPTFADVGEEWTSGRLHQRYPDHVRKKSTAELDRSRLKRLNETIGNVPITQFRLEHAEAAMAALPKGLSTSTRRQHAQLIAKVLKLAVYPLKLIERSPLPPGFVPKNGARPAFSYLYPDEDAQLLGCRKVPLAQRLLYGFLDREGLRLGEAMGLRWRDLDLVRGVVTLDENKPDDPRAWATSPGVAEALKAFRPSEAADDWLVFGGITEDRAAETFRTHLVSAQITRPELTAKTDVRRPIRVHDLRATFVTLSLANGKTEAWVMARTGHKSSQMLNKYRRVVRQAEELNLGPLAPLNEAIPELAQRTTAERASASLDAKVGHSGGQNSGPQSPLRERSSRVDAVGQDRLELSANGLRVRCSTN